MNCLSSARLTKNPRNSKPSVFGIPEILYSKILEQPRINKWAQMTSCGSWRWLNWARKEPQNRSWIDEVCWVDWRWLFKVEQWRSIGLTNHHLNVWLRWIQLVGDGLVGQNIRDWIFTPGSENSLRSENSIPLLLLKTWSEIVDEVGVGFWLTWTGLG